MIDQYFLDKLLLLFGSGSLPNLIAELYQQLKKHSSTSTANLNNDDLSGILFQTIELLKSKNEEPLQSDAEVAILPNDNLDYQEQLPLLGEQSEKEEDTLINVQPIVDMPVSHDKESILEEVQQRLEQQRIELDNLANYSKNLIDGLIKVRDQLERPDIDPRITHKQIVDVLLSETEKIFKSLDISLLQDISVPFDSQIQFVADYTVTDEPAKDQMVASSVMTGYRQGQNIIRHQEVIVFKYQPTNQ